MKKPGRLSIFIDIIIGVLGVLLLSYLLHQMFDTSSIARQYSNSKVKLDVAIDRIQSAAAESQENEDQFDTFSRQKGDLIALYIERNEEQAVRTSLRGLAEQYGIREYYLYDDDLELLAWTGSRQLTNQAALLENVSGDNALTLDGVRYYASYTSTGKRLIYGVDHTDEQRQIDDLRDLESLMSTIKVGSDGSIIVVDRQDNTVLYSKDGAYTGSNITGIIPNTAALSPGYVGFSNVDGVSYMIVTGEIAEDDLLLLSIVPEDELDETTRFTTTVVLSIFATVVALIICYAAFLRTEDIDHDYMPVGKWLFVDRALLGRVINVILVGMAVIILATFYIETLTPLARRGTLSDDKIESVTQILEENDTKATRLRAVFDSQYTQLVEGIAYQLDLDPDLGQHHLQEIAERSGLKYVTVLDVQGRTAGSSYDNNYFRLSKDEDDQSYEFWDILNGYRMVVIQEPMVDDAGETVQWIGCNRRDDEGLVEICLSPELLMERLDSTETDYVLERIAVENDGFLFAVSADEEHTILSWPGDKKEGMSVSTYGLTDSIYQPEYSGFQTISGVRYLVSGTSYQDKMWVYVAVPLDSIYQMRLWVTLVSALLALIILSILTLRVVNLRRKTPAEVQADQRAAEAAATDAAAPSAAYYETRMPSGRQRRIQSIASRWGLEPFHWSDRSADSKVGFITQAVCLVDYIALIFYLRAFNESGVDDNIISYIMRRNWEKGINIFSLTYVVGVMTTVIMAAWVVRMIVSFLLCRFGARMETVARLLNSFIKYAAVIAGGFHCLSAIGVDTSTLVTTAGIVSFVVGIGANRLIGDIIAGVFIVMEGEFRVGDIITVGDWRGTVVEIGIRTTKVENSGNIKILSNSSISDVINMTKEFSTAAIDVGIEYGESLERVEAVLARELPDIRKRIPAIVHGPFYKGVVSLGDSSVNIRIVAQVHEKDRWQVQCDLNREIKLLFDANNIGIPFPQVVVNQPETFRAATEAERRDAKAFNEEQKALSQNANDSHIQEDPRS